MPTIVPGRADLNFTPTSMALASASAGLSGTTFSGQMLAPVTWLLAVNDQVAGPGIGFPARSVTPLIDAVYVASGTRAVEWNRLTVRVRSSYDAVDGTVLPLASFRVKV